jgi:hypothetical protein
MNTSEPGDAFQCQGGAIGIVAHPNSTPIPPKRGHVIVLTMGEVFVRAATDVTKHAKVRILAGGALSMVRRGRPPKGSLVMHDAWWVDDCRAGELGKIKMGLAMGRTVAAIQERVHSRIRREDCKRGGG